jgi:hypothetical protein
MLDIDNGKFAIQITSLYRLFACSCCSSSPLLTLLCTTPISLPNAIPLQIKHGRI